MDELWDDYLQYLIWRCHLEYMRKYSRLFACLHAIPFTWTLDRDDNREADGIELRDGYSIPSEYSKYEDEFRDHWCSVLEMLIALAIRVDDDLIGDPAEEHPEEFFMVMIRNLGLDIYKGNRYSKEDVIKIVDRWLWREFDRSGRGSPFPLKYVRTDQRKVEIWDQMSSYVSENYYI